MARARLSTLCNCAPRSLDSGDLAARARALQGALRGTNIQLLINGRVDVALAVGAAGVHLTSHPDELTPGQVRALMSKAVVSVSCHTLAEVERAREAGANWLLFGPVFEKRADNELLHSGVGLSALVEAASLACGVPILALGGVTEMNAQSCVAAGAAGVAAIRMFR